jgi:hypothetical protein
MCGNLNHLVEFIERFIPLSELQEVADKLTCVDFAT